MTNEEFNIQVEKSFLRSKNTLIRKGKEYSGENDRLEQFHRAGHAQNITPTSALIGMTAKHFTSVADMAKDPHNFSLKQWHEKTIDIRNYTFLLEALLVDLGIE